MVRRMEYESGVGDPASTRSPAREATYVATRASIRGHVFHHSKSLYPMLNSAQRSGEFMEENPVDTREVVLYSRKGCHLCEIVKESLGKLSRQASFQWREVDVNSDTELRRRFSDEVP